MDKGRYFFHKNKGYELTKAGCMNNYFEAVRVPFASKLDASAEI